jgi:predicted chitinase
MKRIIDLNENDIKRIVVRVIKEESGDSFKTAITSMADLTTKSLQSFMDELTGKSPSPSSDTETSTETSDDSTDNSSTNKVEFGKISTSYGGKAKNNIGILIAKMNEKGITDPKAQIGMLVTIGKESGFIPQNELPYSSSSPSRIRSIFRATKKMSDDQIDRLKKDPKKFFDVVYGPTGAGPGLGNTQSGDGSKFIGRGFNQITGRANYRKYGYESNPEALNDVGNAAKAAVEFLGKEGSALNNKFKTVQDAMKYFVTKNAGGRPSSRGMTKASELLSKFSIK